MWNFLIPLFRESLEKLKTEFPYLYPLPIGRHLEKRGYFIFSVYLVITVNFYKKAHDIIFVKKNTVYIFYYNLFIALIFFSSLLTMIVKHIGDDLLKAGTARKGLLLRQKLFVEKNTNTFCRGLHKLQKT